MTLMAHDIHCVALRQLETALRLYFEREDYYSVITLAGASEEVFASFLLKKLKDALREYLEQEKSNSAIASTDGLQENIEKLQEKFEENDKLCEEILEILRNDEEPNNLPGKLRSGSNQEKKLLRDLENIIYEKLEGLEETIGEKNDSLKIFLEPLKWMFDSYMPTMDSLVNAGVKIGNIQDNEALAACRTWLTERVEALSWERFSGLTVIDSGWPAIQCQESCSVLTGPVVAVVAADRLRDEGGYSPVTPTSGCASACSCKPASPTPTHPPPCRDRARGTAGSPSPA